MKKLFLILSLLQFSACVSSSPCPAGTTQQPITLQCVQVSPSPSASPLPVPTVTVTVTPSPLPVPTVTVTVTPSPTPSPTVKPSPSPTPSPTVAPSPSPSPSTTVESVATLVSPQVLSKLAGSTQSFVFTAPGASNCNVSVGPTLASPAYDWYAGIPCTSVTPTNLPVNGSAIWVRIFANYSDGKSLAADFQFTAGNPTPLPSPSTTGACSTIGTVTSLPYCAYAPTSVWDQVLPTNPALNANSTAMIAGAFQNYSGKFYVNPPGVPGTFPTYFTKAGDPTVQITLTEPYGTSNLESAIVPMPKNVVPAAPGDAHLNILNPANGNSYEYYEFPQNQAIVQGEVITVGFGSILNYQTGTGWGGSTTASGAALLGGLVTVDEFLSGKIHHALAMAPGCNNSAGSVYPATSVATYTCPISKGNGIPHGSRIWSDLTPTQVNALGFDKISTILLTALNQYGGFVTDTNGWVAFDIRNILESPESSIGVTFWQQNGGNTLSLNSQTTAFWTQHLHVLQVCVSQGTC
jgi:hypothetical protein